MQSNIFTKTSMDVCGQISRADLTTICLRHERLRETKEDTKDAPRKSQHSLDNYGKVLFLTPDGKDRMCLVNDDGSLGEVLDLEDMESVLEN